MDSKLLILLSAAALLLLIPNGYINAAAIIQKFEGFRSIPYYDVNGYAIGYGSKFNYDQNRPVLITDRINQTTANKCLNFKKV